MNPARCTFTVILSRQVGATDAETGKRIMAWQTVVQAMPCVPPATLGPKARELLFSQVEQAEYQLSWTPFPDSLWSEEVAPEDRRVKPGDRVTFCGRTYTIAMLRDDSFRPTGPYWTAILSEKV